MKKHNYPERIRNLYIYNIYIYIYIYIYILDFTLQIYQNCLWYTNHRKFGNDSPKFCSRITVLGIVIRGCSSQKVFFFIPVEDVFVAIKLIDRIVPVVRFSATCDF